MANNINNMASIKLIDGDLINFFNKVYEETSDVNYYSEFDPNTPKYKLTLDSSTLGNKYRCAYYQRSFSNSGFDGVWGKPQLVLCLHGITEDKNNNITAQPLYELISPSITKLNTDEYQLSWWSNVTSINNNEYVVGNVVKFSYNSLEDDLQKNSNATQILCTAPINWELLQIESGSTKEISPRLVPVIRNISVLYKASGLGCVTDFAGVGGGGGGGGLSLHTHTSNEQGGFAAAVFMPSANMRTINWK